MSSFSTALTILLILLLGFAGYYYLDEVRPAQRLIVALQQENEELALQIEQLETRNAKLAAQIEAQVKAVSKQKEEEIARLKGTYEELISELNQQVQRGEITITRLADQLKVNIVDRIIFPSGQAELTPEGEKVLRRVGKILKGLKDKHIRVAGHTDNVPIHPKLQTRFPSNWELSVARATNVVRFLQEQVGIDGRLLEAAGFADTRPVASNKTRGGRARNRRIEILLVPKLTSGKMATR